MLTLTTLIAMLTGNAAELDFYVSARGSQTNVLSKADIDFQKITEVPGNHIDINDDFNNWLLGGQLAVGMSPWSNKNIRHELGYFIVDKQISSINIELAGVPATYTLGKKAQSLLFNTYYDFPRVDKITPYIGAGIGIAFLDEDANDATWSRIWSDYAITFAYAFIFGIEYDWGERLTVDIISRYFDLGCPNNAANAVNAHLGYNAATGLRVDGFDIAIGLRYTF